MKIIILRYKSLNMHLFISQYIKPLNEMCILLYMYNGGFCNKLNTIIYLYVYRYYIYRMMPKLRRKSYIIILYINYKIYTINIV